MLVIGEKYKFTEREVDQLNKKFDTIYSVNYKKQFPSDTISDIENHLSKHNVTIIVLNIKAKVDDSIIKYLTNIQYKHKVVISCLARFEFISDSEVQKGELA